MAAPQWVQAEAGRTMDLPAGKRMMTTFRKLPMTRPKMKKNAAMSGPGMLDARPGSILGNVPHEVRGLNDGARGNCLELNTLF